MQTATGGDDIFTASATELVGAAFDGGADDRVISNPKNGALSYDPDGIGAAHAVEIAVLPKKLKGISYHDFFVI